MSGEYHKSKRHYLLEFTDHGVGMSEDELNNMFIPYFTTKNIGLGLAYCKNVIVKHGGIITAKSVPEKGTTIKFPANKVEISDNRSAR